MLEMLSGQNAMLLLVVVAGFWFTVRFVVAPRRGAPGLADMFRREAVTPTIGLGREAIASLLGDTRQFAVKEAGIRGLLLAGAYASRQAEPSSPVVLIALADEPLSYRGEDWLTRWHYIKRGHDVLTRDETADEGIVRHQLRLRGAPPVEFHFLAQTAQIGDALEEAFEDGLVVIDDPAGQAANFRQTVLARLNSSD